MKERIIRLAIDFGSTVSAMGWQLLEKEKGGYIWETVPDFGWKKTFPTVILQKKKNAAASWPGDLFADDAVRALRKAAPEGSGALTADLDFKENIFSADPNKQAEAVQLAIQFFGYLRMYFENNHNMSEEEFKAISKEVFVTKPLIATIGADMRLLDIAKKAGFIQKNGYSSVKKMDEVRALADLAMLKECSLLRSELEIELSGNPKGRKYVLFIDIGGLTADISVAEIRCVDGHDYEFKQLGMWPTPGTAKNALGGGVMLDITIKNYLEKHGFIHPKLTEQIIGLRKYMDFSDFKIAANDDYWAKGLTPNRLHSLGADYDNDCIPPRDYEDFPQEQLSPARMMCEVGADYIRLLTKGVREAIRMAQNTCGSSDPKVCEENIDWVFLTGGGSRIFFLKTMLVGMLPRDVFPDQLRLEKLRTRPERILENTAESPTLSCVSGTLAYTGRMLLSANAEYEIELALYPSYTLKTVKEPLRTIKIPLLKKGEPLPKLITEQMALIPFTSTASMSGIRLEIRLLQNEQAEARAGGKWATMVTGKDAKTIAKDAGNVLLEGGKAVVPAAAVGVAAFLSNAVSPSLRNQLSNTAKALWANNSGGVRDKALRLYSDLDFNREEADTLEVRYSFTVDKDRILGGQVSVTANTIRGQEKVLELNLG